MYFSVRQWPRRTMTLLVRTGTDPSAIANTVRSVVSEINPNVPVAKIATMEQVLSDSIAQPRRTMLLLGVFATVALSLATLGLYGVLAHFVNQRTHEIGVRVALGAGTGGVIALVLRRGLLLVGGGVVIGIGGALATTRFMQSMLFGVETTDVSTFVVISLVLAMVAAAACLIPAYKAARVDPLNALRAE
jgi:putative ABC transport system permease protein